MKKIYLTGFLFFILIFCAESSNLRVAGIFGDEMVLQQKSTIPIWGWATPGSHISLTVSWEKRTYSVAADKDSTWKINIKTPLAGGPYKIFIRSKKSITINNVYIGEVWLASGQSNMAMSLKECHESTDAILSSKNTNIRYVNISPLGSYKPMKDTQAKWIKAAPENVSESSAVAWYFASFIQKNIDVPIGIINASFGGSIVESWISRDKALMLKEINVPELSDNTTGWVANIPTTIHNGMLNPIIGFGIKGCIWYQGESNVYNYFQYSNHFAEMVSDWRESWGEEFPFYFTQITPFDYTIWNVSSPAGEHVGAFLRDEQRLSLEKLKKSGMAVTLDLGEREQIHPVRKKKIGERLGLLALAEVYGLSGFEYKSPVFNKMEIDGEKAVIYFKDLYFGITSFGKPLELFEIAGESKVFHKAEAYVDEERDVVVVSSKNVKKPVSVRYAFRNFIHPELFSLSGLPVSSFRTDNW